MIINYTYLTFDSGTTHHDDGKSGVQHASYNERLSGIVAPYFSEIGNNARTPRITGVGILSSYCVRD